VCVCVSVRVYVYVCMYVRAYLCSIVVNMARMWFNWRIVVDLPPYVSKSLVVPVTCLVLCFIYLRAKYVYMYTYVFI